MIDFATLQGLTIPEGVVTQITDASGNVLWAVKNNEPVVLQVEKITSDTYAGETTYTGEQFILLDIYPKTASSTVNVTYGGLTKTLTFGGTNAQQVFFGTFNGVSDEVETPASGTLTIEGDYKGFAVSNYQTDSKSTNTDYCDCVTAIVDFGTAIYAPTNAFRHCSKLTGTVTIPKSLSCEALTFGDCTGLECVVVSEGVRTLGRSMINGCTSLKRINIPASVTTIGDLMGECIGHGNFNCPIIVDSGNSRFKVDGNCLIRGVTLLDGYLDSVIPTYIEKIENQAFTDCSGLTNMTIPSAVTEIRNYAFSGCTGLTSVTFDNTSGWYVTQTINGDLSTGTAIDVSDPANNVTLITDTYKAYYWYRS